MKKVFFDVRNKDGKLVAKALLDEGLFLCLYKRQLTTIELPIGGKITIERDGVETQITRISATEYIIA